MSARGACGLAGIQRTTLRYQSMQSNDSELRERLRELAKKRVRFGYRRLWALLRRERFVIDRISVGRWTSWRIVWRTVASSGS